MTSEIVVMNKIGIAMAADSASTFTKGRRQKVKSSDKIFKLSERNPIGIMVFGNSDFMGVPWETIITEYRNQHGRKSFDHLGGCCMDFFNFIRNNEDQLFSDEMRSCHFCQTIEYLFSDIKSQILKRVEEIIEDQGSYPDSETERVVSSIISRNFKKYNELATDSSIPEGHADKIVSTYSAILDWSIKEEFENLPINETSKNELERVSGLLFTKNEPWKPNSGIVIGGFGARDIFPSYQSFEVKDMLLSHLRYSAAKQGKIDFEVRGAIEPFAQTESMRAFLDGVDPRFQATLFSFIEKALDQYPDAVFKRIEPYLGDDQREKIRNELLDLKETKVTKQLALFRSKWRGDFVKPMLEVVSILPKDELASMAESLVFLSSLKKKVSLDVDTVMEPIDVAVVSKRDGFIWVKRKMYYPANLNPKHMVELRTGDN